MAQLLSFGFDWRHQPYPISPKISQMAFQMPLGAFIHNLDVTIETVVGAGTAAKRDVGTATGNVMEVGAFGLGLKANTPYISLTSDLSNFPNGLYSLENGGHNGILIRQAGAQGINKLGVFGFPSDRITSAPFYYQMDLTDGKTFSEQATLGRKHVFRTTQNTAVDANGFIKSASPIVQLFSNKIELNSEAEEQDITFEKIDIGHYLIKESSGFAQEGWYIETPKDANGNVLFSVIYETLENGDISVKTYKKKFDLETASIVADLDSPIDITEGRWIDLRLQEVEVIITNLDQMDSTEEQPAE